jgi:tRNA(fMet)-specific endonuclease VapC
VTRFLIDSDCAIFAMEAIYPALGERLSRCMPGDVGFSTISFAEVALGSEQGKPPPVGVLEKFVQAIPLIEFDEAAARAYAKLPFKRARFDRLLAGHALALGAIIITNNEADFADVPGLKIENWTLPL